MSLRGATASLLQKADALHEHARLTLHVCSVPFGHLQSFVNSETLRKNDTRCVECKDDRGHLLMGGVQWVLKEKECFSSPDYIQRTKTLRATWAGPDLL